MLRKPSSKNSNVYQSAPIARLQHFLLSATGPFQLPTLWQFHDPASLALRWGF